MLHKMCYFKQGTNESALELCKKKKKKSQQQCNAQSQARKLIRSLGDEEVCLTPDLRFSVSASPYEGKIVCLFMMLPKYDEATSQLVMTPGSTK